MERIGVRELRRDASRWLARARAGERIVITERGDPIAELGPLSERTGYDALVADGRIVRGTSPGLDELIAGLDEVVDEPSLSGALDALRSDER